jgi:hypothetical protein
MGLGHTLTFVADQLADGRKLRALTVVDVFTRESLCIRVGQRLRGEDVVNACNQLVAQRGAPVRVFVDNGSEFSGRLMDLWAYHHGVQIDFSRPGKPTDNCWALATMRFITNALHIQSEPDELGDVDSGLTQHLRSRATCAWTTNLLIP